MEYFGNLKSRYRIKSLLGYILSYIITFVVISITVYLWPPGLFIVWPIPLTAALLFPIYLIAILAYLRSEKQKGNIA